MTIYKINHHHHSLLHHHCNYHVITLDFVFAASSADLCTNLWYNISPTSCDNDDDDGSEDDAIMMTMVMKIDDDHDYDDSDYDEVRWWWRCYNVYSNDLMEGAYLRSLLVPLWKDLTSFLDLLKWTNDDNIQWSDDSNDR